MKRTHILAIACAIAAFALSVRFELPQKAWAAACCQAVELYVKTTNDADTRLSAGNGTAATGAMRVSLASDSTGQVALATTTAPAAAALGDAIANPTTTVIGGANLLYSSAATQFQRQRAATGTTGIAAVNNEGTKATFSSSSVNLALATSATDVFCISPSASKTVRVTRVQVSLGNATPAFARAGLVRRSTLDTSGTAANGAAGGNAPNNNIASHDPTNDTATATLIAYTANPTLGTLAGVIRSQGMAAVAGTTPIQSVVWDFTTRNTKGVVLTANSTQQACINFAGGTSASTTADIDIEWSEE